VSFPHHPPKQQHKMIMQIPEKANGSHAKSKLPTASPIFFGWPFFFGWPLFVGGAPENILTNDLVGNIGESSSSVALWNRYHHHLPHLRAREREREGEEG
jgi:hypothetical protein